MSPERICRLFNEEGVTHSAGVPTVWLSMIDHVEDTGAALGKLDTIIVGGSSAPPATIRWFRERGIRVKHLWGMTEMSPIGTVGAPPANWDAMSDEEQVDYLSRPGRSMFGVELRIVDDEGKVLPRDGKSSGQLQTRGACGRQALFQAGRGLRRCRELVRHRRHRRDPSRQYAPAHRSRQGRDQVGRASGSARSSSRMPRSAAPASPKPPRSAFRTPSGTSGRCCSSSATTTATSAKTRSATILAGEVAKWWLPDAIEFVEELPHTATGKLSKKDLRDKYRDYRFANAEAMVGRD